MLHIESLLKSFFYAFTGLLSSLYQERNLRIHLAICSWMTAFCCITSLTTTECALVALCCGIVVVAELFNSAIEGLVDLVCPQRNALAGSIKDIAAGAVLVSAILAIIVGYFIFIPTGKVIFLFQILTENGTSLFFTSLFMGITMLFIFCYPHIINKLFLTKHTNDTDPL